MTKPTVKIYAKERDAPDEDWKEITDLYWFEENGVHDFDGQGHYERFTFRFVFEPGGAT